MAFVVARPSGGWEIRESHATPRGPRSRTLAFFRSLTPEVMAKAQSRSAGRLDAAALRRAAERAGAPIRASRADGAAGDLLAELAAGRPPRPTLRRLLLDGLEHRDGGLLERDGDIRERDGLFPERGGRPSGRLPDSVRAAAGWIAATPQRRGEALRDLLLLADRLPRRRRPPVLAFPPMHSARR
jgi:hypothetical protein